MAVATKERPILFSGEMVRAILAGRKTQTRRVIKPQPPVGYEPHIASDFTDGRFVNGYAVWQAMNPYGLPGDRLWVRETFSPMQLHRPIPHPEIYDNKPAWYKADNNRPMWAGTTWKPSIFMPRHASRITLEITGVRVERVQDISEADAIAEGAQCAGFPASLTNRGAFAKLWDSINSKRGYSWESNPWVWVVEFGRVTQ